MKVCGFQDKDILFCFVLYLLEIEQIECLWTCLLATPISFTPTPLSACLLPVHPCWRLLEQIRAEVLVNFFTSFFYPVYKYLSVFCQCRTQSFKRPKWYWIYLLTCLTACILQWWEDGFCLLQFSSVHLFSRVLLFATPWTAARQASLSITNSQSSPKPMSIESVMPSNHLILCRPLLLLPSIFPSIRIFSNESALHIRYPKYWSLSFNISPTNEHPGLISFRMDWLDLLAVQGTLKSLLQHHSSKASILRRSAFFIVQLSHLYDHWKNHSLD